jgi:hypothetical protein
MNDGRYFNPVYGELWYPHPILLEIQGWLRLQGAQCTLYPDPIDQVLEQVRDQIEYKSSYAEEYILDCIERPDDWLSGFEQSQLEYDGAILCPEPTINYEEIVNV